MPNIGSHMGIDATRKLPAEGYTRGWPELLKMDPEVRERGVDALLQPGHPITPMLSHISHSLPSYGLINRPPVEGSSTTAPCGIPRVSMILCG